MISIARRVRQAAEKDDRLTPDQARVLRLLEAGARPQAELMEATGFKKHKLSGLIGQLRRRGLVKVRLDDGDSRKHNIQIKRQGRDLLRKLDAIVTEQLHHSSTPLDH